MSKLFQHELDHLNGILMIDDISKLNNLYPIDETEKNVEKYQTLYSAYNKLKK